VVISAEHEGACLALHDFGDRVDDSLGVEMDIDSHDEIANVHDRRPVVDVGLAGFDVLQRAPRLAVREEIEDERGASDFPWSEARSAPRQFGQLAGGADYHPLRWFDRVDFRPWRSEERVAL